MLKFIPLKNLPSMFIYFILILLIFHVFRSKSAINWKRLVTDGKMAKASGIHASYSIPYTIKMMQDSLPTDSTAIDNENIRMKLSHMGPEGLESCMFYFNSLQINLICDTFSFGSPPV